LNTSRELLLYQASQTGFRAEILEKVFHLFGILEGFRDHPALKGKMALKGGTALNLFILDVPRLSVDIDLNYIGVAELEEMKRMRPDVERAIVAVCERRGLIVKRIPGEHAGGKWRLQYKSALGQSGSLEIDVNFLLRVPLWPVQVRDSREIGIFKVEGIPVLDVHELAVGKIVALFARRASRDLFDVKNLMALPGIDKGKLRLGFVVYSGMNRKDLRSVGIKDVSLDLRELKTQLLPMLRGVDVIEQAEMDALRQRILDECREQLSLLLPFTNEEVTFLEYLNERGELRADLLSSDTNLQKRILNHPGLLWKVQNVKQYRGLS